MKFLVRLSSLSLLVAAGGFSSAMNIVATYDSTLTSRADFAQVKACIDSAVNWYNTHFSDPITVNFTFKTSGTGLGSNNPSTVSVAYSTYRTSLAADATTAVDTAAVNSLPAQTANPVNNTNNVTLARPNARAVGLSAGSGTDDTIDLNVALCFLNHNSPASGLYDLYAVTCHEIDEGLGSPSGIAFTNTVWAPDLFRYKSAGVRTWDSLTNHVAYFSYDGGVTNVANYNQLNRTNGDWADWDTAVRRVQNWAGTSGVTIDMGIPEVTMLDAIGYTPVYGVLTGKLTIGSFLGNYASSQTTLSVYNVGGTTPIATATATVKSDGTFTAVLPSLGLGTYDVGLKTTKTLSQRVGSVNVTMIGASGLSFALINGDVDNNNIVNINDYSILSDAFNTTPGSTGYDDRADLDGNQIVNINDYSILSDNFGLSGQ